MQWLISVLGSFALGLVVGYLVQIFIKRSGIFDAKALVSIIGAISGGVILGMYKSIPFEMFGSYCVGLFGGVFLMPILLWLLNKFIKSE